MKDLKYDDKDLLAFAPTLAKHVSGILPINSLYKESYKDIKEIQKLLINNFDDIISNTIKKERSHNPQTSFEGIISKKYKLEKEMVTLAHLREDQLNTIDLERYLQRLFHENPEILSSQNVQLRTNLRRLIRIYDYLKGKQTKSL